MKEFVGRGAEDGPPKNYRKPNPIEQMFSLEENMEIFSARLARMSPGSNKKVQLCDSIRGLSKTYFYGKENELNRAVAELEQKDYRDEEELVAAASLMLFNFSRQQITPAEMEQNIRNRFRDESRKNVNEIITYDTEGDALNLHLDPAYTMDIAQKLALFRSGFNDLASRLINDEKLKDIKVIKACSWIVAKNTNIFIKLGFTFDRILSDEEKAKARIIEKRPVGIAHISREDFIAKHGNL